MDCRRLHAQGFPKQGNIRARLAQRRSCSRRWKAHLLLCPIGTWGVGEAPTGPVVTRQLVVGELARYANLSQGTWYGKLLSRRTTHRMKHSGCVMFNWDQFLRERWLDARGDLLDRLEQRAPYRRIWAYVYYAIHSRASQMHVPNSRAKNTCRPWQRTNHGVMNDSRCVVIYRREAQHMAKRYA